MDRFQFFFGLISVKKTGMDLGFRFFCLISVKKNGMDLGFRFFLLDFGIKNRHGSDVFCLISVKKPAWIAVSVFSLI